MSGAFGKAWQLLKEVYPPPNYTEVGGEDAALAEAEKKWQARFAPEEAQEFTPPPVETKPLPNDFFERHVHSRLVDRERIHNENEETEVRDRITDAMQGYVDKFGNYKLGVPKHIAIRTHLLNNHRQPDLSNEKSNGDSIVGVVRPNKRNPLAPKLETVMLRRSELSHAPQAFKAANLRVDKVINAHGLSKRAFKRLVAQSRNVRTGEPMDLAWRLLKGQYPKDDPRIQRYREIGSKEPIGYDVNTQSNKKMRDWIHEWLGEQRDEETMTPYHEDEPYTRSEIEDAQHRPWWVEMKMRQGKNTHSVYGEGPWFGPGTWKKLIAEGHEPKIDPWYHSWPSNFAEKKGGNEAEIDRFSEIAGRLVRSGIHPKGLLSAMSDFIPSSSDEPRRKSEKSGRWEKGKSGEWEQPLRSKPHEQALRRGDAVDLDAMNSYLGLPHEQEPVYGDKVESTDQAGRLQPDTRMLREGQVQYPDATGGRDWEEEARIRAEEANNIGSLFG